MTTWEAILLYVTAALSAASILLHAIAPRTKNKWDDTISARVDELLGMVKTMQPPPVVQAPPLPPGSTSIAGALLVLMVLGLGAPQLSCAAVKAAPSALGHAVVVCAKADQVPIKLLAIELLADALTAGLKAGKPDWDSLESKAAARGLVLGGCAYNEFVAALDKAAPQTAARGLLATADPAADARASQARLSARFDGATWQ